jgi:hypothetical protein
MRVLLALKQQQEDAENGEESGSEDGSKSGEPRVRSFPWHFSLFWAAGRCLWSLGAQPG